MLTHIHSCKNSREHGYKIKVIVTKYDSPEVDIPKDITIIEEIINRKC